MEQAKYTRELPKEDTYFIVFGRGKASRLVEGLIKSYNIPKDYANWLSGRALGIIVKSRCNVLVWRAKKNRFELLNATGHFLEYVWLKQGQPRVIAYDVHRGFYDTGMDKGNTSVFYELERSLDSGS